MIKTLLTSTAVALFATSAFAADLGYAPPVIAQPVTDWSGFYAGITVGAGAFEGTAMDTYGDALSSEGDTVSLPGFGAIAGVGVGYDAQFGSAIFGVEADLSYVGYDESIILDDDYLVAANLQWLSTIRAKAGVAVDNATFYVTGGLGFGGYSACASDDSDDLTCTPDDDEVAQFEGTVTGLVAGVGTEAMVTESISLKAEYLYFQSGTQTVAYDGDDQTAVFDVGAHILRGGVNFRF